MIPMPKKPWPIWAVGWLALLSFPLIALIYATEAGRAAGGGDHGFLILGSLGLSAFVGMPVVFFATYFAVEDYDPNCGLFVWRRDRPLRSTLLTLLLGLPAAWLAAALLAGLDLGQPWYEWLRVPWLLLVIAWLLLVRAAAINRRSDDPIDPQVFG